MVNILIMLKKEVRIIKVQELQGVLREGICILYKGEKEFFIPLKTNAHILSNHNDETLWEKYGEMRVKEIFNEYESIMIELK